MFEKNAQNDFSFTITMRQLSLAIAGLLLFSFFIFIAGYFLGQKRAAQEFAYRADQDSLADQIYSSMCILHDPKDEEDPEGADDSEVTEPENATEASEQTENKSDIMQEIQEEPPVTQKNYKAVLSGFPESLLDNAQQMVARLTRKGYKVDLVERTSSYKKNTKKWYQVVTKAYPKDELQSIKPQLAKIGQVKEQSIKIEECA